MTEEQWGPIADRIALAWSAFGEDRRRLYFEVLNDLDADAVERAVDELIREGREEVPPPGVVRRLAIAGQGATDSVEGAGADPPAPEAPNPEAPPGLSVADIFGAQLPGREQSSAAGGPIEATTPLSPGYDFSGVGKKINEAPFNWLALSGLLVPLLFGLLPWLFGDDAYMMRIDLIVPGAIGLGLSIPGLRRANRGVRRGRDVAIAGIAVSTIALVAGFGSLWDLVNDSTERREAAEALGADRGTVSDADLGRVRDFDGAIQEWNAAAADVFFGYQEAMTPQEVEEWIAAAPGWIAGMQAAHRRMREVVDGISDPGIQDALGPLLRAHGRLTALAGRLHGAVRTSSVDRELAARRELQDAAEDRARITRALQEKIEAVRRAS